MEKTRKFPSFFSLKKIMIFQGEIYLLLGRNPFTYIALVTPGIKPSKKIKRKLSRRKHECTSFLLILILFYKIKKIKAAVACVINIS